MQALNKQELSPVRNHATAHVCAIWVWSDGSVAEALSEMRDLAFWYERN